MQSFHAQLLGSTSKFTFTKKSPCTGTKIIPEQGGEGEEGLATNKKAAGRVMHTQAGTDASFAGRASACGALSRFLTAGILLTDALLALYDNERLSGNVVPVCTPA